MSELLDIQNVSGLWSVKAVNCLPSRKIRKCLMPRYNTRSSRSKALYFVSEEVVASY